MTARDLGVDRKNRRKLALAEKPGELSTMCGSPRRLPVSEEDSGVRLDRKPTIRRGHSPVSPDPHLLIDKRHLVGFVSDVFDNCVGHHQVESSVDEWQVSPVGNQEVRPCDRVFCSAVEPLEQDSTRDKHLDCASHSVGDDILERLVLAGLHADNQHAVSIDRPNDRFQSVGLAVPIEHSETARSSRDELSHDASLWHAIVAKPIAAIALGLLCLIAASCSSGIGDKTATSPADEGQVTPRASDESPDDESPDDESAATQQDTAESTTNDDADQDSTSINERGARDFDSSSDGSDSQAFPPTATPEPNAAATSTEAPSTNPSSVPTTAPSTDPTAVPTTAPVATAVPSTDPTAVPTTAPLATAVPAAPTQVPTATPQPSPTPQPATDQPFVVVPEPTGPVPSDDIVVTGPTVDESESSGISESAAAACASAERAIDYLDIGDTNRLVAALDDASQSAASAPEAEIAAVSGQLAAAGADEAAATAAILAALNACAIHGYQV